jgi:hypothetical protein
MQLDLAADRSADTVNLAVLACPFVVQGSILCVPGLLLLTASPLYLETTHSRMRRLGQSTSLWVAMVLRMGSGTGG